MFELEKQFYFEAGHVLKFHDGQCKDPHGHSYSMTIHVRSTNLMENGPKTNMVMDFSEISRIVKLMINEYFEHKWLNKTLQTDSPTAEFIAKWVYDYLSPSLPGLHAVTLQETASSRVIYTP